MKTIEIKEDTFKEIQKLQKRFPMASVDTAINVAVCRELERLGIETENYD